MARQACLTSLTFILIRHGVDSLNLHPSASAPDETVCVSLAAFETPDYIDGLIKNFLHFSEKSTKLAIHFDASSEYNGTEVKWASDRVAITKKRIEVEAFHGSVLYSHILNVDTMEKEWPGQCAYWVFQASNMMWVRSGMEEHVREYRFSPLGSHEGAGRNCAWDRGVENSKLFVDFSERLASKKNLYGYGQPEGSFFPFLVVKHFKQMMDNHLKFAHDDGSGIHEAKCYFENVWLQTYALNWEFIPEGRDEEEKEQEMKPLSLNRIHYGDKENDCVDMKDVKGVMKGKDDYKDYYAVKRVNREVSHPTTKFIINLAK